MMLCERPYDLVVCCERTISRFNQDLKHQSTRSFAHIVKIHQLKDQSFVVYERVDELGDEFCKIAKHIIHVYNPDNDVVTTLGEFPYTPALNGHRVFSLQNGFCLVFKCGMAPVVVDIWNRQTKARRRCCLERYSDDLLCILDNDHLVMTTGSGSQLHIFDIQNIQDYVSPNTTFEQGLHMVNSHHWILCAAHSIQTVQGMAGHRLVCSVREQISILSFAHGNYMLEQMVITPFACLVEYQLIYAIDEHTIVSYLDHGYVCEDDGFHIVDLRTLTSTFWAHSERTLKRLWVVHEGLVISSSTWGRVITFQSLTDKSLTFEFGIPSQVTDVIVLSPTEIWIQCESLASIWHVRDIVDWQWRDRINKTPQIYHLPSEASEASVWHVQTDRHHRSLSQTIVDLFDVYLCVDVSRVVASFL